MADSRFPNATGDPELTDSAQADLGFGDGGVPIALLLFYLAFLVFFTWYTVDFQLPAFESEGPVSIGESEGSSGADSAESPVADPDKEPAK